MKAILIVWLLVMGVVFGPVVHLVYIDYQTYQDEYQADVVEGNQL